MIFIKYSAHIFLCHLCRKINKINKDYRFVSLQEDKYNGFLLENEKTVFFSVTKAYNTE